MSTDPGSSALARAAAWCFRSRVTGRITIAQTPNAALIAFGLARIGAELVPAGAMAAGLRIAAGVALAIWALDELARGVNPWRRALGAGVLVYMLAGGFG